MLHEVFAQAPLTLLTGAGAILFMTCGPALRSRNGILLAQLGASACFVGHYWSLGILAASAVSALGLVQTGAAIFAGQSTSMNRLGYVLILLMIASGLWLWQGPISALSVTAMSLIALGRMQCDELRLRLLLLLGSAIWIAHDLISQAWFALTADIGAFVIGSGALLAMFVRVNIEWRRPAYPIHQTAA